MSAFRRAYGAAPWHLLVLLGCFALTAYVVSRTAESPALLRIAVWFVGVAVVWDLVLGPVLALADRLLRRVAPDVRVLNHVRAPALVSALLLLLWLPLVRQRSEGVYRTKTGLDQDAYLGRWLAVTGVLFAVSAAVLAVRVLRARSRAGAP